MWASFDHVMLTAKAYWAFALVPLLDPPSCLMTWQVAYVLYIPATATATATFPNLTTKIVITQSLPKLGPPNFAWQQIQTSLYTYIKRNVLVSVCVSLSFQLGTQLSISALGPKRDMGFSRGHQGHHRQRRQRCQWQRRQGRQRWQGHLSSGTW